MHLTALKKMEACNRALADACADNAKAAAETREAIQQSNGTFKEAMMPKREA